MSSLRLLPPETDALLQSSVHFLLKHQCKNGAWYDFRLKVGFGSSWPTAYVGLCLAKVYEVVPDKAIVAALQKAVEFLLANQSSPCGWGYHAEEPSDADSTSIVLRFMTAMQKNKLILEVPDLEKIYTWLNGHLGATGASTYMIETIQTAQQANHPHFIKGAVEVKYRGWISNHLSVGCSCALAIMDRGSEETAWIAKFKHYIVTQINSQKTLSDYWWRLNDYPNTLVCKLFENDLHLIYPNVAAAVAENPFSCGLALQRMALQNNCIEVDSLIRYLALDQKEDGSFHSSANMRVPLPWVLPSEDLTNQAYLSDENRFFTTATVCEGLAFMKETMR